MNDPERILIVRLSHLGDVACTLGLLHALHGAYPHAKIAWAIQPEFAPLVGPMASLERTILFERYGGVGAWLRVRRELRRFKPDMVVDAQGNMKSAAITWLAGAKRRVGMARADWKEPVGSWVVNDPAPRLPAEGGKHLVKRIDALIEHILGPTCQAPARSASPSSQELNRGHSLLDAAFGPQGTPLLISISAPGDPRSWPMEHWTSLLSMLADSGRPCLILHGPTEAESAARLRAKMPSVDGLRCWALPMQLRELHGLMAAAAERGLCFLGIDSGPMHLAWCVGLRVTVLEGPCDAGRTGPWPLEGAGHRVLYARDQPSCSPCLKRLCDHPEGNLCMSGIQPEDVLIELL